jgi:hypothetical protein
LNRQLRPGPDSGIATTLKRRQSSFLFSSELIESKRLRKLKKLCHSTIVAAPLFVMSAFAIEVIEPAGAEHGYPGLSNINGKKLADGEFRQWMQDERLHVVITYKFPDGQFFQENALFREQPELIQEQWSWKESKNGQMRREFAADFLAKTASAHIRDETETKDVSDKIEIEPGRTFAGFGFTIALANLRPRLIKGEQIELKAIGFAPKPLLKPMVVTVKISHGGLDQMKMCGRFLRGDRFIIHPEIPVVVKLFVRVPDTKIWLTNPPPAGFLRWQGPVVLPTDPIISVDLVSDSVGGPAEPVETKK